MLIDAPREVSIVKATRRRLKVFQAQIGFFDTIVAAPSQAAALRAWGIHQNLFASGQAQITEDRQAVEVALAHAETPLKRAVGSADAYGLESANLPKVPDTPKGMASKPKTKAAPAAPKTPHVDRSTLNAAEAALRRFDDDRKREEATFRLRQDDLDAEREAAQATYVAGRRSVVTDVATARETYRKAGGKA